MEVLTPHMPRAATADQLAERAAFSYVGSKLVTTQGGMITGVDKPTYVSPGNVVIRPVLVGGVGVASPYRPPTLPSPSPPKGVRLMEPLRRAMRKTRTPAIPPAAVSQVSLIAYRRAIDAQLRTVSCYQPSRRGTQPYLYSIHTAPSLEARFQELVRAVSGRSSRFAHSQDPATPRARHTWYVDEPLTPPPPHNTKTVQLQLLPIGKAAPRVTFDPDLE